jgi:murein hydrolase activator
MLPAVVRADAYDTLLHRYERQIRQQEKQLETLRSGLIEKEKEAQHWQQKAEDARAQWSQAGTAVEKTRVAVQGVRDRLTRTRTLASAAEWSATEHTLQARATDEQMAALARAVYRERLLPIGPYVTIQDRTPNIILARLTGTSVDVHAEAEAAKHQELALRTDEMRFQDLEQKQSAELDKLHQKQQSQWSRWQEANRRRDALVEEKNQMEESAEALRVVVQELHDHRDHAKAAKQGLPADEKALASLRGTLPWPAEGRVTQNFGRQYSDDLKQLLISNGIKIEVGSGHNVRAVDAGKVLFARPFREYGQLVIVRHPSGLTSVYGSLGEVRVKEGDALAALDVIGTTGESGSFYFELRHEEQPMNPLVYLAPPHYRSDLSLRRKFK